jgi:hypothetical protein
LLPPEAVELDAQQPEVVAAAAAAAEPGAQQEAAVAAAEPGAQQEAAVAAAEPVAQQVVVAAVAAAEPVAQQVVVAAAAAAVASELDAQQQAVAATQLGGRRLVSSVESAETAFVRFWIRATWFLARAPE